MNEPCDLLKERWYVVGQPWGDGTWIRARAEDAAGVYVCGIDEMAEDVEEQDYRAILSYICALHNAQLREPVRQLALADARAAKAEADRNALAQAILAYTGSTTYEERYRLRRALDALARRFVEPDAGTRQPSQNVYDTLFETHQREMDRFYALLGVARRFRDAVRAVDGIADAEQALLAVVEQLAPIEEATHA